MIEGVRAAIACVLVVGCGRLAFDPLADAGASGGGGDSIDTPQALCTGFDVVVDLPQGPNVGGPGVVWTGSEYYVVIRTPNYELQQVGPDGVAGGTFPTVPAAEAQTAIAWSGAKIGIVSYLVGGAVNWRAFDPVTHTMSAAVRLNPTAGSNVARIAWAGDRFIVAWYQNTNVYAREISDTGTLLSAELLLSTTGGQVTSVAATPSTYVFGVDTTSGPVVVTYQRSSMLLQTVPVDVGTTNGVLVVARADGSFASTCGAWMGGTTKIQLHDTTGAPTGAGITSPLTTTATTFYSTLEPTTNGYRLSGIDGANPHQILSAQIDAAGTVTMPQTTLGSITTSMWGAPSSLATAGRSLLALPYDGSNNPTHIRLIQSCAN